MGEYIKNTITGEEKKIGVLDNCFFSRKQIKEWLDDPAWIGWYAGKEEAGTLGRFYEDPKTLYDGVEGLNHKKFAIKVVLDDGVGFDHDEVQLNSKSHHLGNGYRYTVDCQFKGEAEIWVTIAGERYNKAGEGRTIFACDCCGALLSLPQSTVDIALENMDLSTREYLKPILKGIKDAEVIST
ncbi:MAG: hypothetical protein WC903_08560 [Candidatus Margulisiibacteriota bacterium]